MVNIDFFRDLLAVIKDIMIRASLGDEDDEGEMGESAINLAESLHLQILCVLTAFELMTGQGISSSLLAEYLY